MEVQSSSSHEDICRVCRLGGTPERPLFHPCMCTGSIRYVHQDCLMQWLRHSRKEYCELCHYKFQFASIYRADMPKWLPFQDIYRSLVQGIAQKLQRWLHLWFVVFIWLYILPVCTYRIYGVIFNGDFWSAIMLPLDIITFDNLILECLIGLFIVIISLLGFISLAWLKDQLTNGRGPDWLTADQQEAQRQRDNPRPARREATMDRRRQLVQDAHRRLRQRQNSPERGFLSDQNVNLGLQTDGLLHELTETGRRKHYRETAPLRAKELTISYKLGLPTTHLMPVLRNARLQNIKGVESWRDDIFKELRRKKIIPPDIDGLPTPAAIEINRQSLPSLQELGLSVEESTVFELFLENPSLPVTDQERLDLETELQEVKATLESLTEMHMAHQERIAYAVYHGKMDENELSKLSESEQDLIQRIWRSQAFFKSNYDNEVTLMAEQVREVTEEYPVLMEPDNVGLIDRILNRNRQDVVRVTAHRRRQQARPNIGQALAGLAREPQDPNAEAVQADQLTKMLGLDGSFQFLEHVMWMLVLMTTLLVLFAYIPNKIGELVASRIFAWNSVWVKNWKVLLSTSTGYIVVFGCVVGLYYGAGLAKMAKSRSLLGIAYLALKISILLALEAGVFPLFCGWWMDICSFSLVGASLKDREESLRYAPGTVMFLHWLAGMIFVFYFASFVVLLREILRPGVLWFLRNLNDQNFHPIQDMIAQPLQRHLRRFIMSNIMFGVSILIVLFIPSRLALLMWPKFLPYNLTLMSSVSPIREVQLELILLQFVIPTLLEHSNTRAAIKASVKQWSILMARIFNLRSYLLDEPQTGGNVMDMHGKVIQALPYDPNWEGPVYTGPNQVLGPGFPPFKPYLRPRYFGLRMIGFICCTVLSILTVSTFFLIVPVFLGRLLMYSVGVESPPDIYTTAIGFYVLWILGKAGTAIIMKSKDGLLVVTKQLILWLYQGMKCVVAAFLLFVVIPLLLGDLVNLLIISPIRVPMNKTPIVYYSTEWALGLLHMKCSCGIIWLTDTSFKRTLDRLYQRGVRNLSLTMVITEVAWPVISNLFLCIVIPYVFFIGVLYTTGLMSYSTSYIWYRYFYCVFFIMLISLSLVLVLVKQSSRIYTNVRNQQYLIGRQLVNYGMSASDERSQMSVPEQETGEQ